MGSPAKPDPEKYCAACGTRMSRKRFSGRLEEMPIFKRRRFCDQQCMANGMRKERRRPETKFCTGCQTEKSADEFGTLASAPDLLRYACRPCEARRTRASQIKNPERVKAYSTKYQTANAEAIRERDRQKYWANREQELAKDRARRDRNPEVGRAAARRWAKANPDRRKVSEFRYRALEMGAAGKSTVEQIAARVAYYGWLCWLCRGPWVGKHVDHVIPLSKGGSNWPANLRPICRSCNTSKGNRWVLPPAGWVPPRLRRTEEAA